MSSVPSGCYMVIYVYNIRNNELYTQFYHNPDLPLYLRPKTEIILIDFDFISGRVHARFVRIKIIFFYATFSLDFLKTE